MKLIIVFRNNMGICFVYNILQWYLDSPSACQRRCVRTLYRGADWTEIMYTADLSLSVRTKTKRVARGQLFSGGRRNNSEWVI